MNDAPAEAADAIVVEDAPDVAVSPNAGGEDSPGSLVHQGTIIDADIAVAEPHHPVAPPAFADEPIAPEDDAVVAPASPQSDENLDDIDGDTAVRDDPTPDHRPRPPRLPFPKKTQLCLRTSRIFFFSSPDLAFHYVNCRAKPRRMTARAPVRAHPDPRTGRSAMLKMSKKMPKKKKDSRARRVQPLTPTTPSRI